MPGTGSIHLCTDLQHPEVLRPLIVVSPVTGIGTYIREENKGEEIAKFIVFTCNMYHNHTSIFNTQIDVSSNFNLINSCW